MTIGRIVVVPEFQGFGLGVKFINEIAKLYIKNHRVRITTSLKPYIKALNKHKNWKCVRYGRVGNPGKTSSLGKGKNRREINHLYPQKNVSSNRITHFQFLCLFKAFI